MGDVNCAIQDMRVQLVLDVMHIEKNIAEFVLKFLFGEKDTIDSQRDLHEITQKWELWLRHRPN